MKHTWLTTEKSSEKLIIFFTGWGMNGSEVEHLDADGCNVLCLYDYTDLNMEVDLGSVLLFYKTITIVAYSFGVWAAAKVMEPYLTNISKAIAINGTTKPIDENYGIPEAIFDGTLATYSEAGQLKFSRRMCGDRDTLKRFNELDNTRTIEEKREELRCLGEMMKAQNLIQARSVQTHLEQTHLYDLAIISKKDRIMPTANQQAFWDGVESTEIESGHFPIFLWTSWQEPLRGLFR